jgi:hypothetical protein
VSRYARTERDLREALAVATTPGPERERMIAAGRALFAGDPADDVMELASCTRADQLLVPFQHPRGPRRVAILAASIAALYGALTIGAAGVSALGVGVAKAPSNRPRATYLGVRVDAAELFHTSLMTAIRELHATLVVDALTADQSGRQLAYLAATGIDIGNGGWGQSRTLRWNRAHDDCKKAAQVIAARAHTMPEELVPSRRIDAFDQIYCHTGRVRQRLVEPNTTFVPGVVPEVKGRHVYLLDARDRDGQSVVKTLESFHRRARRADLSVHPLEDLH